jgi:hypothetical protein
LDDQQSQVLPLVYFKRRKKITYQSGLNREQQKLQEKFPKVKKKIQRIQKKNSINFKKVQKIYIKFVFQKFQNF